MVGPFVFCFYESDGVARFDVIDDRKSKPIKLEIKKKVAEKLVVDGAQFHLGGRTLMVGQSIGSVGDCTA